MADEQDYEIQEQQDGSAVVDLPEITTEEQPDGSAIIEMENGPEVAYFLGKNPEICEELCQMSPFEAVRAVGRIADDRADLLPCRGFRRRPVDRPVGVGVPPAAGGAPRSRL